MKYLGVKMSYRMAMTISSTGSACTKVRPYLVHRTWRWCRGRQGLGLVAEARVGHGVAGERPPAWRTLLVLHVSWPHHSLRHPARPRRLPSRTPGFRRRERAGER